MTKEPQATTQNAERRARSTCREKIGDWVFSEENRKESMLLADRRKIMEIWSKVFGDLEKTCGEIRWRFGEDVFGNLEKTYSAIFGEHVLAIWRNRSVIWRKPFGDNVGDLAKRGRCSYGDFILEFSME